MDDRDVNDDRIQKSPVFPKAGGSCLILLMRHLGDAVIAAGIMNALHTHNPTMTVDILGRREIRGVAASFGHFAEYIEIDVPLFGHHRRNLGAMWAAFQTMRRVRRRKYDYCINVIGDFRENLIGKLTGAKWNIAPVWGQGHLFKKKMTDTNASWFANYGIDIPSIYSNYYDSLEHFARQLGLQGLEWRGESRSAEEPNVVRFIGLHPGASHASRRWPNDKWRLLARELNARGYRVKVLGSLSERDGLLGAFSEEIASGELEVSTVEMPELLSSLSKLNALIGMDSFSVHAAHALNIPTVVLNGSSDPTIMTPPGGAAVSAGHLCKHFPCYYDYPCVGTEGEYVCVRGIEVEPVLKAFESAIRGNQETEVKHRGLHPGNGQAREALHKSQIHS